MKTSLIKCSMVLASILLSTCYAKAQVSFSNDYAGQCPPVTVNFTNTSAPYSYFVWDWSDGSPFDTTSGTTSISHTFTEGGGFSITLNAYDSSWNYLADNVNDLPITGVNMNISADSACPGDFIYFDLNTSNEGNIQSANIFWDFGDGNTTYGWDVFHAYSGAGTYTVTLIVSGTTCGADTIMKSIYIGNAVAPVASINMWPDPVCPNDLVNFNAWGNAGSFYYTFGDGSDTTLTNPNVDHVYNTAGIKTVTMAVINGCGLTDNTSATLTVQNGLPFTGQVDFNVPDSACPGDGVSFDCWDCADYAAFSWDFGDGSPTNTADTRASHSYAGTGTYITTLTVLNGCGNAGTFTKTVVIANNVSPDPNDYDNAPLSPIACPTDSMLFFAGGGAASYFWDFGDGNTDSFTSVLEGAYAVVVPHAYTDTGTYTVTFTLTNGCGLSFTNTYNIYVSDTASIYTWQGDGPSAFWWVGIETGIPSGTCEEIMFSALLSGSTFSWNWGDGNSTITNTMYTTHAYNTPGTYTISLFVQNSCGDTTTVTSNITISGVCASLSVSASGTGPACKGGNDGSATASVSGGAQPYTYLWNDPAGQTTATATGLSAGAYTVIVTDSAGDNATAGVTLTPQYTLSISFSSIIDASCGGSDGVATASTSGGASPYSYQWSNGTTGAVNVALSAGFYIVTVTDANGCSDFALATVSDNDGPIITVVSTTPADCNGSGGAIDIFISQGTSPYTYLWSNGSITEDIGNLSAGPYEVSVADANGCVGIKSIVVAGQGTFSLTTTTTDATCGNPDGSATVNVNGGTGPFTYAWSGGGNAATESNILAGIHAVTVTDANGCVGSATATVSEVGGATITIDSTVNEICNGAGGAVYISVTGGVTPYSYLWSNSDTIEDIIGVSAGAYDVTVTGANGCIATANTDITMTSPSTEPICLVTVDTITGKNLVVWEKLQMQGVESYNIYKESTQSGNYYLIDNVPATSLSEYVDTLSDPLIRSWRYKISSLDSCGNESGLSAEHKTMHLTVNLGIPPAINLIWDHYQGFTFSTYYIYRYTTATGWVLIDSIQNNLTSVTDPSPPTGNVFYQIAANPPSVCVATKTKNFNSSKSNTSSLGGSAMLTATVTAQDAAQGICDGEATVTASDGTPPYTYLWNDLNNQTTATATGLCGNTAYTVLVTDANSDSISASVTVGETIGIAEKDFADKITISPNPNTGNFSIIITALEINLVTLKVFTVEGQLVLENKLPGVAGEIQEELNLSEAGPGVYYIQVVSSLWTSVKKVVVQ